MENKKTKEELIKEIQILKKKVTLKKNINNIPIYTSILVNLGILYTSLIYLPFISKTKLNLFSEEKEYEIYKNQYFIEQTIDYEISFLDKYELTEDDKQFFCEALEKYFADKNSEEIISSLGSRLNGFEKMLVYIFLYIAPSIALTHLNLIGSFYVSAGIEHLTNNEKVEMEYKKIKRIYKKEYGSKEEKTKK